MRILKCLAAGTSVIVFLLACSTMASRVPLPDGIRVKPPTADLPADVRAFSGKWYGKWDNGLEHMLVVEEITASDVFVTYANGALPESNIKPGYQQVKGAIEDKTLNVYLRGVYLWYDLQPDGSLEAHWTRDHKMVLTCKMTRLK